MQHSIMARGCGRRILRQHAQLRQSFLRISSRKRMVVTRTVGATDLPLDGGVNVARPGLKHPDENRSEDATTGNPAPEWVKLVAIMFTSALVALAESILSKRALR
jgi:hypothetical protein